MKEIKKKNQTNTKFTVNLPYNTNVIYIICQYFISLTVVNADGIKQIVQ